MHGFGGCLGGSSPPGGRQSSYPWRPTNGRESVVFALGLPTVKIGHQAHGKEGNPIIHQLQTIQKIDSISLKLEAMEKR